MTPTNHKKTFPVLAWINGIAGLLIGIGIWSWIWLMHHRALLPSPELKAGKALLKLYQATSHSIFLALLAMSALTLMVLIRRAQSRSWGERTTSQHKGLHPMLRFAREHPLVTALFAGYTVAMVHSATWFYPEIVGWFKSIPDEHMLNNFSFRNDFISETMRREDYRFFPLAHQDLHILSWFTGYVKVWMLVSAAELIAIVLLCARFVRSLCGQTHIPILLLLTTLLFLFHPATGMAFFQFNYCERFLTFIFCLYFTSYLHHINHKDAASFYSTILLGLIGSFIKDIAVVLFIIPPAVMLIAANVGLMDGRSKWKSGRRKEWGEANRLELWLCSLSLVLPLAYIFLSLIPSTFANKEAYDGLSNGFLGKAYLFEPDWRFWFLLGFCLARAIAIGFNRSRLNLLDGLNAAAIVYATGLLVLVGFRSYKYLTLPIQLVTVLDLMFCWATLVGPVISRRSSPRIAAAIGIAAALGSISFDQLQKHSFANTVSRMIIRQRSWVQTYDAIGATSANLKRRGEPVNLIYSEASWFSANRHLNRLPFDRLISFNPKTNLFRVEEGTGKGNNYTPQLGDLLISIDQGRTSLEPALNQMQTIEIYNDIHGQKNGIIYRIH